MRIKIIHSKKKSLLSTCSFIAIAIAIVVFTTACSINLDEDLNTTKEHLTATEENTLEELAGTQEEESSEESKKTQDDVLTAEQALEIAKTLVSRYQTYDNYGIACDLAYGSAISQEEYDAVWEMRTEEQKAYAAGIQKCLCCTTYEQAKQHTLGYIDQSVASYITNSYVLYKDSLYFVIGAKGSVAYKDVEVLKHDNSEIYAVATMYGSGDNPCGEYSFIIRKNETDNYQIVGVTEGVIELPKDDLPALDTKWAQSYKQLLLGFYDSEYAEYYTDMTVPVLFDINNDEVPELFVFCAMGARQLAEKGIMFQLDNNEIKAYYCDDFGMGSGSFNNMKLYQDKNGETFILLSPFDLDEKEGIEQFGNSLVTVHFDGEMILTKRIASNMGSIHGSGEDVFTFNDEILNDFESYYAAITDYVSGLTEIDVKSSVKNKRCDIYSFRLREISENEIDMLFDDYLNS